MASPSHSWLRGSCRLLMAADSFSGDSNTALLRVGFSSSMFTDVNENDAKAAVKAWAQVLAKERNIPIDPEARVLNGTEEISRALQSKLVDAVALTTDEHSRLGRELLSSEFIVGVNDGRLTEEYVLLVHRDSGIERVGDLRGRSLNFFQNTRMSLASAWLDTLLVKDGLGRTSKFFGRVTQLNKLPRVILPVFFRQSDACVVTRRGFHIMAELNPQVGQQLKVLSSSPELVPAGFCFRRDYNNPLKERILAEFGKVHTTPAGQQVLTIFQSGRLEVHPISILNSSLELLASHSRLCAATNSAEAVEGRSAPGEAIAGVK